MIRSDITPLHCHEDCDVMFVGSHVCHVIVCDPREPRPLCVCVCVCVCVRARAPRVRALVHVVCGPRVAHRV